MRSERPAGVEQSKATRPLCCAIIFWGSSFVRPYGLIENDQILRSDQSREVHHHTPERTSEANPPLIRAQYSSPFDAGLANVET